MTFWRPGLALGLMLILAPASAKTVTDSAGRRVDIPDRVTRVFTAGPPASALLYVLAPQTMIGWMRIPHVEERNFLLPAVRDLPELGRLTGRGNTVNLEALIGAKPDFILDVGTISDTYRSLADRVQEQTGIPYLLIDGSLARSVESVRLLGHALGVERRAADLTAATQAIFDEASGVLARVPESRRPRVYLARGDQGLETGTRGSGNTEIIERAGGINVVQGIAGRPGLVTVSPEQVIAWAPDTIISLEKTFRATAASSAVWQAVPAVARQRIFIAPAPPFGWIDSPPAINRLIGLQWLLHVFYPQEASGDLRSKARDFYRQFYQVEVSDPDLDRLLAGSP